MGCVGQCCDKGHGYEQGLTIWHSEPKNRKVDGSTPGGDPHLLIPGKPASL
jgi:hypothetical protein